MGLLRAALMRDETGGLCRSPVNSSGRAETFKAVIEVGNRQGGCTAKLHDAELPNVTGTGIRPQHPFPGSQFQP
jgi:hypothetical protein